MLQKKKLELTPGLCFCVAVTARLRFRTYGGIDHSKFCVEGTVKPLEDYGSVFILFQGSLVRLLGFLLVRQ